VSEQTPQDPYAGQPYYGPPQQPSGQYPAQYPQPYPPQYQQQPYPGYPQYAPYQHQPYPYAYPRPPGRPGTATAAAVLAFVAGGCLIVAALFLFAGASIINDIGSTLNQNTDPTTSELTIDGIINLIAAALLIAGGVMLTGRKVLGRTMLSIGSGIVVACSIYWLLRFNSFGATVFYALLFGALVVIAVCMAFTTTSRAWLAAAQPSTQPSTKPAT